MSIQQQKIQIITSSPQINIDFDDAEKPLKPIAVNADKTLKSSKCNYPEFIAFLLEKDESFSSVPIFMKYFAFHETIVLIFGGLYYLQPDIGVVCLSILPGLSIIGIFSHFLLTQFNKHKHKVESTFFSIQHYLVAFIIFILGLSSICFIYKTNTYLSTLLPMKLIPGLSTSTEIIISNILQFPQLHSMIPLSDDTKVAPFNYRISFVGSIIAPIVEESFKYLLLSLTFPISFIWSFSKKHTQLTKQISNSDYSVQSLFIMFIALCGGCGIAIMENIGYLAACQWQITQGYCLPNKNFDILGAGLARGIFSVPFHCVTSCIMADVLCVWMNIDISFFHKNTCLYIIKFILSYPISLIIPIFLHSSFNYWMKGLPFMTGIFTIIGFSFLVVRIAKKYSFINNDKNNIQKDIGKIYDGNNDTNSDECCIDLTVCEPPNVAL